MTSIAQGLLITAIGMGLVFLMILALWGIMALLVALTSRESKAEPEEQPEAAPAPIAAPVVEDMAPMAAAIGVVYALARAKKTFPLTPAAAQTAGSAWLSSGRVRQTLQQPSRGRKQ